MKTLKVEIIGKEGESRGEGVVPTEIFGVEGSPSLVNQAVLRFLSNQRKAQARAKTRSEVIGSGAKIWRQKGTGRARHGDRKAPIFVGGGVAHGPTGEQNYKKKMNQKMIQRAIFTILTEKVNSHKLFLLDELSFTKTKEAGLFLQNFKKRLKAKGRISFLLAKGEKIRRYLRNLKDILLFEADSLNHYDLLRSDFLFLTQGALEELRKKAGMPEKKNDSKS